MGARSALRAGGTGDRPLDPTQQLLSSVVEQRHHEWSDSGGPVEVREMELRRRRRSVLAIVGIADSAIERTLLLKTASPEAASRVPRQRLVEPASASDRLVGEFEALRRLHELGSCDRFFTIEPIELYEETVLVMEFAPHDSLLDLMRRRPAASDETVLAFERAGTWLARFHSLSDREPVVERLRDVATGLDVLASMPYRWPGRVFGDVARAAIERVGPSVQHVPLGLLHGDMAPRNVLVDDRFRVGGIDVAARWRAPVLYDIATFELSLRVGQARRRNLRREALDHLIDAFRAGYGLAPSLRDEADLFYALALLDRAIAFRSTLARSPGWLLLRAEAHRLLTGWGTRG